MTAFAVQDAARAHYATIRESIERFRRDGWAVDPYAWDGSGIEMTAIERAVWADIRQAGLVLYPQWPASGYFLDFASPSAQIAIECDGRQYHDAQRDRIRDARLMAGGWIVYRIPGYVCLGDAQEQTDGDGRVTVTPSQCLRMIEQIGERHGIVINRARRSF